MLNNRVKDKRTKAKRSEKRMDSTDRSDFSKQDLENISRSVEDAFCKLKAISSITCRQIVIPHELVAFVEGILATVKAIQGDLSLHDLEREIITRYGHGYCLEYDRLIKMGIQLDLDKFRAWQQTHGDDHHSLMVMRTDQKSLFDES